MSMPSISSVRPSFSGVTFLRPNYKVFPGNPQAAETAFDEATKPFKLGIGKPAIALNSGKVNVADVFVGQTTNPCHSNNASYAYPELVIATDESLANFDNPFDSAMRHLYGRRNRAVCMNQYSGHFVHRDDDTIQVQWHDPHSSFRQPFGSPRRATDDKTGARANLNQFATTFSLQGKPPLALYNVSEQPT